MYKKIASVHPVMLGFIITIPLAYYHTLIIVYEMTNKQYTNIVPGPILIMNDFFFVLCLLHVIWQREEHVK